MPQATQALEHDRGAMLRGEVWRPVTGQLTHWSWAMAASDLLVIAGAGTWIERRSRRLAAAGIGAALLAVAAVVASSPALLRYRGSSGVATALVALAATELFRRGSSGAARRTGLAALLVLGAKVAVEAVTGEPVLSWTLPTGIALAAAAHVAGAVTGVAIGLAIGDRRGGL